MEIMPSKKHQRRTHAAYWVIGTIVFVIATFALWLIFSQRSTNTTLPSAEPSVSSSLFCSATTPKNPILTANSESTSYKVYALFLDKKLDNIYYEYNGAFTDAQSAKTAEATLHADYNIYAGSHGFNAESYTPSFTIRDNSLKISLYAEANELTSSALPIFFLNKSTSLDQLTEDKIESQLKSNNFTCAHE